MSTRSRLEPILSGGIRDTNFFNGRVLTAEDLTAVQTAAKQQRQQLGVAVGAGVVRGLVVTAAPPSPPSPSALHVTPGLAINRLGETIELPVHSDIAFTMAGATTTPDAGAFAECLQLVPEPNLTNAGVYILTISPASGLSGQAPKVEFTSDGIATSCSSRYKVLGARFQLVRLDIAGGGATPFASSLAALVNSINTLSQQVASLPATSTLLAGLRSQLVKNTSQLRNGLAHLCAGSDQASGFAADAFSRGSSGDSAWIAWGALDELRLSGQLQDCEVPIALLFWTASGTQFIDRWGVRRPVTGQLHSNLWPLPVSTRRFGEAEAMYLQMEEQLEEMFRIPGGQPAMAAAKARDMFRFMPAAGFLPVLGNGSARGFDPAKFFSGVTCGGITSISSSQLAPILFDSWLRLPVDLSRPNDFRLYRVRENTAAVTTSSPGQLYLMWAARSTDRVRQRDNLVLAFEQAWIAYRGLIRKRAFIPTETSSDASGARVMIVTAIQDVMDIATRLAAIATAGVLDYSEALGAMQEFYAAQKEFTAFLQSSIPGSDPRTRLLFAQFLNMMLDGTIPGGIQGLKPAIQAGDLPAAVRAQTEINSRMDAGSEGGAALGFIEVNYDSSPDGDSLVPGQTFTYIFNVANRTDRTLTIDLAGQVTAPRGNWEGAVSFRTLEGAPISSLTVDSQVVRPVVPVVAAPADAVAGDSATLSITISVGPPHNKTDSKTRPLTVAASSGPAVIRSVAFTREIPPAGVNLSDLVPTAGVPTVLEFQFDLRLSASQPPTVSDFQIQVLGSATPAASLGEWAVFFVDAVVRNPQAGVWETDPIQLDAAAAADTRVGVRIRIPSASSAQNKTFSFRVVATSLDLTPAVTAESTSFNLTVLHV